MKKISQQMDNNHSNTSTESHTDVARPESLTRRRFLQAGAGAVFSGMLGQFKGRFLTRAIAAVATGAIAPSIYAEERTFTHPGLLHTEEDFPASEITLPEKSNLGQMPGPLSYRMVIHSWEQPPRNR
nr:hypothetical protein KXZ65_17385 [Pectobacterium sp. PL152]